MPEPIFLDHNSTTPLDKRVLEKMLPYFCETYGNPSSADHFYGLEAKKAVETARKNISKILGCRRENEIIFTSGATESNNLALTGIYRKYRNKGNHIISTQIEHPSVLEPLKGLKKEGAEITLLPVDRHGLVSTIDLKKALKKETILISVIFANNEIGTIEPVKDIGDISKDNDVIFHCDAAQAAGHLKINVYEQNIDLLSFSGHKFYGPKGIGGLFVRTYSPFIKLSPLESGGGQERGLRPGTLNVPGIVGMAEALTIASKEMKKEHARYFKLSQNILTKLKKEFPDIKINGHPETRLAHNINITIPGVENKALLHTLKDKLAFSSGSACSATKAQPSYVLRSIGLTDDETFQSIRIGLGRSTKGDGIAEILIAGIKNHKLLP